MANTPTKFRPPRVLLPWNDPANQADEQITQIINDFIQELERVKLETSTVSASGAEYGDILVANQQIVFRPQKFVPLGMGVGLAADPIYRFQVHEGQVDFHVTESASGGAYGTTLTRAGSGTSRLSHLFASGSVVRWEVGMDTNGDLLVRDHLTSRDLVRIASPGTITVSGDATTIFGSVYIPGSVTTGPLQANTLVVTGTSDLLGIVRSGPLTANTLEVTGAAGLRSTVTAGPLTANSLIVSGSSNLQAVTAGPVLASSLAVTGASSLSGNVVALANVSAVGQVSGGTAYFGAASGLTVAADGAWAFDGRPPVTQQTYVATNVSTDRTFDANATSLDEIADVLGTLIADLQAKGALR